MRLALLTLGFVIFAFGCTLDESPDRISIVTDIPSPIRSTKLLAKENKAYIVTYKDLAPDFTTSTDVYRVDLQTSVSTKLLTTDGSCDHGFAIASDEKFAILSTYIQKSNGYETRVELVDIESKTTKTLLSSSNTFYFIYALSADDKYLLYNKYGNGMNTIRRRNLLTGDDIQISANENAVYVALNPVTNEILVNTYSEFYWMDWDGAIKSGRVKGLTPMSFSNDGKLILCRKGTDIYTFDIGDKTETQITNTGDDLHPHSFSSDGANILFSTDKDHASNSYLYELYTVDIWGTNLKRLTINTDAEFPLGFFQQDKRILFTSSKNPRALYSINL